MIHILQVVVLAGPGAGFMITRTACRTLQEFERERLVHGAESGVIVRLPNGGYVEQHQPIPARERFVASSLAPVGPRGPRHNRLGTITSVERLRWRLSRLYLTDARAPQRTNPASGTPAVSAPVSHPVEVSGQTE